MACSPASQTILLFLDDETLGAQQGAWDKIWGRFFTLQLQDGHNALLHISADYVRKQLIGADVKPFKAKSWLMFVARQILVLWSLQQAWSDA